MEECILTRFGVRVRPRSDRAADCKARHADVWPGSLNAMRRNNWRNFDNFPKQRENLLFGILSSFATILQPWPGRSAPTKRSQRLVSEPIPSDTLSYAQVRGMVALNNSVFNKD